MSENFDHIYTAIEDHVLVKYVTSMEVVYIPESVEVIATNAFEFYNDDIPDYVSEILFEGNEFIKEINIPASVRKIETGAFATIYNLKRINIHPDSPAGVVVNGTLFSKDMTVLIRCVKKDYETYIIPKGTKVIGANAFYNCRFKQIVIPDTVERIEKKAFNGMSLNVLELPSTVCEIGENLFGDEEEDLVGSVDLIRASAGSYAIQYAKENGIEYEEV